MMGVIWFISLWIFINGLPAFLLGWIGLKKRNIGALIAFGGATILLLQLAPTFLQMLNEPAPFLPDTTSSAIAGWIDSPISQSLEAVASLSFGIGFLLFAYSLGKHRPSESPD